MEFQDDILSKIPPGYRFLPTDEELITDYLMKKVCYEPLPPHVIPEIDDTELHSKAPSSLVTFSCGEREWYFFIHEGEAFPGRHQKEKKSKGSSRTVGDGKGFWKANGKEQPICNSDGKVFAFKIHLTYFSGSSPGNARKTHWKMEKYRLPSDRCHKAGCYLKFETNCTTEEYWMLHKITPFLMTITIIY
eukprot:XP_002514683.2 NAC transcription factor 32 [Ricinus communis]